MKYLTRVMFIAVLALPLSANAKIMSYVFEGDVVAPFSSSIITDTNISQPATITGVVVYDTNAIGASTVLGGSYEIISVEVIITSQTDVELRVSTDTARITTSLFSTGIYLPSVTVSNSDVIDINWGGSGLGGNTSPYIPDLIRIGFPPQSGASLLTEAKDFGDNILGSINVEINGIRIQGLMRSMEIVEGQRSKAKSSASDDSSSGSFSPIALAAILLFLSLLVLSRRFYKNKV